MAHSIEMAKVGAASGDHADEVTHARIKKSNRLHYVDCWHESFHLGRSIGLLRLNPEYILGISVHSCTIAV